MNHKVFQPRPNAITFAIWEQLGKLTPQTRPVAGINWRDYVKSGGPAMYIGRGRK